jgi:hypothetical protein
MEENQDQIVAWDTVYLGPGQLQKATPVHKSNAHLSQMGWGCRAGSPTGLTLPSGFEHHSCSCKEVGDARGRGCLGLTEVH